MADSRKPGPGIAPWGSCRIPSRTPGPLGRFDQADPNITTLLGDTPGPLGVNDWAMPGLPDFFSPHRTHLGTQSRGPDGAALSLGSDPPAMLGSAPTISTKLTWDDVRADFERWEGKVPHMYLDTKGLVTVGIGKMLPDVTAAKALGFVRREDSAPATAEEIETDFKGVSKQTKGKLASSYKQYTKLDLPDEAIDDLLKKVVEGFEAALENDFTGYQTYPVFAKRALLDMIYNLGEKGLLKFKTLKAAVEAGDWKKASEQCHRIGPSEARNNWTRDMFIEASK